MDDEPIESFCSLIQTDPTVDTIDSTPIAIEGINGSDERRQKSTTPPSCDKRRRTDTKPAIRHAEARRVGTCRFANRVASISVDHYKKYVPEQFRIAQPQTCLATIVAHWTVDSSTAHHAAMDHETLQVLAMGVGTKFLSEHALMQDHSSEHEPYGSRVRDCHGEVLARRAFRRYLTHGMQCDVSRSIRATVDHQTPTERSLPCEFILERCTVPHDATVRYQLKPGVTLHFYTSSTPCGNSAIKQFATLQQEIFLDHLAEETWPTAEHERIPGHSIALGQFAVLVKRDHARVLTMNRESHSSRSSLSSKQKTWPVHCRTDWCPPGTSTVWSGLGRLHTCSDKLARWNVLGYQGSLLASILSHPLYVATLTVGRKFSHATCRRAVCCRAASVPAKRRHEPSDPVESSVFTLHHPAIMGTSVYMDETGVVDTSDTDQQQHVRFAASECWASWSIGMTTCIECIDGTTGRLVAPVDGPVACSVSKLCTTSLTDAFLDIERDILRLHQSTTRHDCALAPLANNLHAVPIRTPPTNLNELRQLKITVSGAYERTKLQLLTKHPVMRDWQRREQYENVRPAKDPSETNAANGQTVEG